MRTIYQLSQSVVGSKEEMEAKTPKFKTFGWPGAPVEAVPADGAALEEDPESAPPEGALGVLDSPQAKAKSKNIADNAVRIINFFIVKPFICLIFVV
jgi:hypothetical protein